MRMPNENENLVGKICICSDRIEARTAGSPAIVAGKKGENWVGICFDGERRNHWTFSSPVIIAESISEFYSQLFEEELLDE